MVTTKTTPVIPAGQTIANRMAEERQQLFEAADYLLAPEHDGQPLTAAELSVLESLGWSDLRIKQEHLRLVAVRELQGKAGTTKDLAADKRALKSAGKALEVEGPKLQKQIEELAQQLRELESGKAEASQRVAEREEALAELAKDHRLRGDVREDVLRLETRFAKTLGRTIVEAENRIKLIDDVAAWHWADDPNSPFQRQFKAHCYALNLDGREHPGQFTGGAFAVTAEELDAYQARLRVERGEVLKRIEQIKKEAEPGLAEIAKLRRFYVHKPGAA